MAKKAAAKSAKELAETLLNPRKNGFFKVTDEKIEKADCYVKLATINSLEPEKVGKELNEWIGKISKKQ